MNEEIQKLILQRAQIVVALDDASSEFHELAKEASKLGLYIRGDFEVCGDPMVLSINEDLVRSITKKGEETKDLTDRLTDLDQQIHAFEKNQERDWDIRK